MHCNCVGERYKSIHVVYSLLLYLIYVLYGHWQLMNYTLLSYCDLNKFDFVIEYTKNQFSDNIASLMTLHIKNDNFQIGKVATNICREMQCLLLLLG